MYYAEGTHEPIIAHATFEQAKERLRKIADGKPKKAVTFSFFWPYPLWHHLR